MSSNNTGLLDHFTSLVKAKTCAAFLNRKILELYNSHEEKIWINALQRFFSEHLL